MKTLIKKNNLKIASKNLKKLGLIMIAAILYNCSTDDGVNSNALPLPETLKNVFAANLNSKVQVTQFDAGSILNFTSAKGVKLIIYGSCLKKNGNPVVGNVKVEFIELFDKASMLTTNKATMGKTAAGEDRLLVSGGEFYTRLTQDGVELTSDCGINLQIPTSLTGGTDNAMLPFTGTTDADGNVTWEQASTTELIATFDQASGTSIYNVFGANLGWFNCDRFLNYPGNKTTITTYVPQGYANLSHIFLTTKDVPNSLGKTYGEFPVGLECNLIFVTEKDGKFRYAIKQLTALTKNHTVTFTLDETTIGTPEQLTTAINALP